MEIYPSMGSSSYDKILKTKAKCRYSGGLWAGEGRLGHGMAETGTAEECDTPGRRAGILAPTLGPGLRPGPLYGDSGTALPMASEALSAAACNDFVDRCA